MSAADGQSRPASAGGVGGHGDGREADRFQVALQPPTGGHVTVAVHRPVRSGAAAGLAALLLPGAGGTLDTPGLVALSQLLAQLGVQVVRANLPYREQGRRTPPKAERSVPALKAVLEAANEVLAFGQRPNHWLVGGKSYGSRVASLAVADGLEVAGLLCYGYPLHPPGRPDQLRVDHWPAIKVPTLILQGGLDPFGTPDELAPFMGRLAQGRLASIEGADHSLRIAAKHSSTGRVISETEVIASLRDQLADWLSGIARGQAGARR